MTNKRKKRWIEKQIDGLFTVSKMNEYRFKDISGWCRRVGDETANVLDAQNKRIEVLETQVDLLLRLLGGKS